VSLTNCPDCGAALADRPRQQCIACGWSAGGWPNMVSVARDIAAGMTHEQAIAKAARQLADAIDADILERVLAEDFYR
jgi:hypothetical protein